MSRLRLALAAASTLLLAGCASSATKSSSDTATTSSASRRAAATDPASALRAWANGGGSASLTAISNDLSQVSVDLNAQNMNALQTSCAKLTADVETDQASTAVPDKTAESEWSLMLTHLQKAADSCTQAASSGDPSQLSVTTSELAIGLNHLGAFNTRLHQIMG